MPASRRPEQAPGSEQDWIALADQLTGQLFRIGLSLQAASGKPQEIADQFIAEALEETGTALHSLRNTAFRIASGSGRVASADADNGSGRSWTGTDRESAETTAELEYGTSVDAPGHPSPNS